LGHVTTETTTPLKVDLELVEPSVCMAAGRPATVLLRVGNLDSEPVDLVLTMRGRMAALAVIEPAGLRLAPGETRTARITFQPGHGPHVPSGPMPYAVSVRRLSSDDQLGAAFGLIDVHQQRPRRSFGSGAPCIRSTEEPR
jgi:hypothetical protein